MKRVLLLTFFLLLLSGFSFCQEYSYTHYDVKEGLAGSNVYCVTQDKDGFLWMGTEGGLSRFDGTHFTNFTLEDGLPDIEVLQTFADSRGRIWMAPFTISICYYFQGRIHNQENDPLLRQIHLKAQIHSFAEDAHGNILIAENDAIHLFTPAGEVKDYYSINGQPISCAGISSAEDGNFLVDCQSEIYHFSDGSFTRYISCPWEGGEVSAPFNSLYFAFNSGLVAYRNNTQYYRIRSLKTGKSADLYEGPALIHVSFSVVGDSLAYNNEADGTQEYNIATGAIRRFRLGTRVSRVFRDDEGNTWFTTLGQGIYRLNSDEFRNVDLLLPSNGRRCVAHSIRKMDDDLLVGTDYNALFRFSLPSMRVKAAFNLDSCRMDELNFVHKNKKGELVLGTSVRICKQPFPSGLNNAPMISVKQAIVKNDSEIVSAGRYGVQTVDPNDLRIKDTLFRERATTVNYIDGALYIGTVKGLYILKQGQLSEYFGSDKPYMHKRISAVQSSPSGVVWIATYGDGIIACKDGKQVGLITRKQGLSSDICRTMQLDGNTLWVGTDKGLNKVDIGSTGTPVTIYTSNDGLASDIINTIFVDGSMVYVGTPNGLSFFNAGRIDRTAACRLVLSGIINSGRNRLSDTSSLRLPYTQSNIRFEFAGISYRSAGNIWYRYRLLGLDTSWKRTRLSFLEYPTLPSGDYELQLQATNRFGVTSRPLSIRFTVLTPFWKTVWFDAAALLLFLFLISLFVNLRFKQLRRRQMEQEEQQKRLAEMEHMALQAQMNPHFIFNCLNSIQQYIFDQDILAANKYITGFAKLIRATLHNSSKAFISLSDEIDYLSTYLSLEKLRFKEKMNYIVDVEPSYIPEYREVNNPKLEVVFIGRGSAQKRVHLIAAVATRMHTLGLPAHFSFVGDVENVLNPADLPFCKFYGKVTDEASLQAIRQASDVLLLTSAFEGLPMVVMEMMAFGKVVISTAVNAIPDYITHMENGLLIMSKEEEAIIEEAVNLLRLLIQQPALKSTLGRRSFETAIQKFGHEVFCREYRKVLIKD